MEYFSTGDAESSKTHPTQCSSLRKGGYVLLKGHPCKIVEMNTSAPGKHGHAKVHLVGIHIFTARKYEDLCPAAHKIEVPIVRIVDYQVIYISDGYMSLLDSGGGVRDEVQLPEGEMGLEIQSLYNREGECHISMLQAMGNEAIVGLKKTRRNK